MYLVDVRSLDVHDLIAQRLHEQNSLPRRVVSQVITKHTQPNNQSEPSTRYTSTNQKTDRMLCSTCRHRRGRVVPRHGPVVRLEVQIQIADVSCCVSNRVGCLILLVHALYEC